MEGEESVTARWRSGRGFWFVAPCLFVSLQLQLEGEDAYSRESIRDTRPSASALRPCFINRFVNNSSRGSISGGREWALYPRIASGLMMTGAILELEEVDVEAGAGSLKRDEADGAFFINAANASNSEDGASGAELEDVEGVFDNREVVDSDLNEEVSPLNDVLSDMLYV
jgi:hypothetical protein